MAHLSTHRVESIDISIDGKGDAKWVKIELRGRDEKVEITAFVPTDAELADVVKIKGEG